MQTIRGILSVTSERELSALPNIRETLILCHVYNTISWLQKIFLKNENIQGSKDQDMLSLLLITSSFLYEGIWRSNETIKKLFKKRPPNELGNDFTWLNNAVNSPFYTKVLKNIRNKLMFHFGKEFAEKILDYVIQYPPVFFEMTSERRIDLQFTLVNECVVNFLATLTVTNDSIDKIIEAEILSDRVRKIVVTTPNLKINKEKGTIEFHGVMTDDEKKILLEQSNDEEYQEIVKRLYLKTRLKFFIVLLTDYCQKFLATIENVIGYLTKDYNYVYIEQT